MKKTILMLGLAVGSFATLGLTSPEVFAKNNAVVIAQQDAQTKEIKAADLPDAIQKAWDAAKQEGDTVTKVYEVTKGSEVTYQIDYKTSAGDEKTMKFDSNGKSVE